MQGASAVRCIKCPLHESRRLIVDGAGSLYSKLMIVGEAPGEQEDASGSPFVGPSGKLLRAFLSEINPRSAIYLTNAVRCRPPGNRDPSDAEMATCQTWLEEEIERVRPVVLLGVGRYGYTQILAALANLQARFPEDPGFLAMRVLYEKHPAYYLRKPGEREALRSTLATALALAYGTVAPESREVIPDPWTTLPTEDFVRIMWPPSEWLAADTETDDLEESITGKCVGWSLSDGIREAFTTDDPGPYMDEISHVYLANAKYDAGHLGIDLWDMPSWDDIQIAAYLLRYRRVGLKELGPLVTGVPMRPISTILGTGKARRPFSIALRDDYENAYRYACHDALVTSRTARVVFNQLRDEPKLWSRYIKVEKPLVPILYEMERRGVLIDTEALVETGKVVRAEIEKREEPLKKLLEVDNLASGDQLAIALPLAGFKLTAMTKGGKRLSVDEEAIIRGAGAYSEASLDPENPVQKIAIDLLEYRQYAKLESTYVTGIRKRLWDDNSLHCRYNQAVADTNRLSSSDPNLQNIPTKDPGTSRAIKRSFIPRPGRKFVVFDYSQLQLRIFADYTQDPVFLSAYPWVGEEKDIHQQTADQFTEFGVTRKACKNVNFAVLFGAAETKIAATAGVPRDRASSFLSAMRERVPGLLLWQPYVSNQLAQQGYIETKLGFRGYFPSFWSPINRERSEALRQASCFPIQGTEADIMKTLMIDAYPVGEKYGATMLLQVHDELVFECPDDGRIDDFVAEMIDLGAEVGSRIITSVPLRLAASVSDNWGDAK